MKIECSVDGRALSLSVNSDKPLSLILMEDIGNRSLNSHCRGKGCGNCIVLLNGEAVLSCLTPAFRLKEADIRTFESFRRTRQCRDIERAYRTAGTAPCPNCYASRTLIIESILQDLTSSHMERNLSAAEKRRLTQSQRSEDEERHIIRELSLNTCQCMDTSELLDIVERALTIRRRKRVRRT